MEISNWGNFPRVDAEIRTCLRPDALGRIIAEPGEIIPRGLGRCYGDSSLCGTVLSTLRLDKMIGFRETDGLLECEAGVSLAEVLDAFVPRGWFLPVTPGTKFVTVGGAIASDVHGKNHHKSGSFSSQVVRMDVMLSDGQVVSCSRDENADLFRATCGGMGLTGVILRAAFRLIPIETAFIRQETVKAQNLDEIMKLFRESADWTYTVAWIDCLSRGGAKGRSILIRGEHAARADISASRCAGNPLELPHKREFNVPFHLPGFILNGISARAFNFSYFNKSWAERSASVVDYDSFFFPLDMIRNWNRIYGRDGFLQYQFVLPLKNSREGLERIFEEISRGPHVPFLTVLKLFGPREGEGIISFPMEGYTIALDFPIRDGIFPFMDRLDELVLYFGGRHYLTKDARMSRKVFDEGYPAAARFRDLKSRFDVNRKFRSLQSKRVGI